MSEAYVTPPFQDFVIPVINNPSDHPSTFRLSSHLLRASVRQPSEALFDSTDLCFGMTIISISSEAFRRDPNRSPYSEESYDPAPTPLAKAEDILQQCTRNARHGGRTNSHRVLRPGSPDHGIEFTAPSTRPADIATRGRIPLSVQVAASDPSISDSRLHTGKFPSSSNTYTKLLFCPS